MADYIEGVKIAELPEAESVSDSDLMIVEDNEATKQATASMLKDYTNAELLARVASLESQVSSLNTNFILGAGTNIESNTDLNDLTDYAKYNCNSSSISSTLKNCPLTSAGFSLYSFRSAYNLTQLLVNAGVSSASSYIPLYIRTMGSSGWMGWYAITASAV